MDFIMRGSIIDLVYMHIFHSENTDKPTGDTSTVKQVLLSSLNDIFLVVN